MSFVIKPLYAHSLPSLCSPILPRSPCSFSCSLPGAHAVIRTPATNPLPVKSQQGLLFPTSPLPAQPASAPVKIQFLWGAGLSLLFTRNVDKRSLAASQTRVGAVTKPLSV
ncbi:hypothetical protein CgunFtcFv8_005109 [Champsocephalus gunnari]|uniref:Uncharacterized protein n=1 Tax=Champsocephalus gunnari TaxID=52237 RepID=A0AAN8CUW1_CHAGU|nr:hypothetical protein CgunFtcFv8_005109 [Champsocephalus gunnari]